MLIQSEPKNATSAQASRPETPNLVYTKHRRSCLDRAARQNVVIIEGAQTANNSRDSPKACGEQERSKEPGTEATAGSIPVVISRG